MQIDQLVAELLARGDMNDDTVQDLNRILAEWRAGKPDIDDAAYVRALHSRIVTGLPAAEDESVEASKAPADLDGLTIEGWRDRALKAEAELAELKDAASSP
ncbi:MAG: hypothetical protein ABL866_06550 [Devosia sp.]